mmetsp:Transcript_32049/g.89716  ORF Transcript_32049/g.89716 Transcript_32049/m.89716 type:complete len:553 (+) Transcript_32049:27-1685(+)|eukprot:CAMPEP_0119132022 /NCGR_PEP_ID=MMETSP1310-20130426/11181_1 /TAXON_ID=464262 /ORGANISM="Genus nov. species nov., Strain RCC2339" /LENGTH=552 /DNA_ID=CAMNT_0007122629 /DNA_START=27 /DNA_END=1685 /DNA_ORIENTATION=+
MKGLFVGVVALALLSFSGFGAAGKSEDVVEEYMKQGYELRKEFLHYTLVKDSHQVLVPFSKPSFNWEWVYMTGAPRVLGVGAWDFLPVQIPVALKPGVAAHWKGSCYEDITATLTANATSGTLEIEAKSKRSPVCTEFYDFGDREAGYLVQLTFSGKHTISIAQWHEYEFDDVTQNGMKVFLFPMNAAEVAASVLKTVQLFNPDNPNQVEDNVDFLGAKMQWAMQKRPAGRVDLTEEQLHPGDYLAIMRLDGLDPLIAWGTGGHTGHTAVVLRFPDGLHVCESTDTVGANSSWAYFPPPYGICCRPAGQWLDEAENAQFLVAILPLSEENRAQFDNDRAVAWYETVAGSPYGWNNFIFSFFDKLNGNLPVPATPDLMEQAFGIIEPRIPVDSKGSVYNMVIKGLNHRLNSDCDSLHCIYETIDPMGMQLLEVAAIPEQDHWLYESPQCDRKACFSMVCDVFVMRVYQEAGLDLPFQATEQTPLDTYRMNLFENDWFKRPTQCAQADPDLPYCQVLGAYTLTLNGFNSMAVYPDMNHACPAYAPVYQRTPYNC